MSLRSRRAFLRSSLGAAAFLAAPRIARAQIPPEPRPRPQAALSLARRFPDLRRRFVFEYYPWYGGPPDYVHWDQWDRVPPLDLASNYVPRLGAYDSRSRAVLEQHARWIAEAGAGAINVSWWGPGSFEDRAVPLLMDVMAAHDVKVTFHLEPYRDDRVERFASDVLYLLREYGERRRWDALLLLRDPDGVEAPVFKGFGLILPERVRDCHGVERGVPLFASPGTWRRQTDGLRSQLRHDFPRLTLLADSSDMERVRASGFDGIAIYDNFVGPERYEPFAQLASRSQLLFSFNANPGYDTIEPRRLEPGDCHTPLPFLPLTEGLDFARAEERERAARRSAERIALSFATSLAVQTQAALANSRRGFFLMYLNSFNEWHEGHSFEPMQDAAALSPVERAFGYHNPARGAYRLETLRSLLRPLLAAPPASSRSPYLPAAARA